jgi:hypothetical protein
MTYNQDLASHHAEHPNLGLGHKQTYENMDALPFETEVSKPQTCSPNQVGFLLGKIWELEGMN